VESRARGEDGFGLIELLITMVVLNIAILALVAAFNGGIVALARSSHISTASALSDQQMELYRGLTYSCIYLSAAGSSANWTGDTTFNSGAMFTTACGTPPAAGTGALALDPKAAVQNVVGPDHHKYEIDTYITTYTPSNPTGRQEKRVGIAVHDAATGKVWARQQSTFDQSTGS
jgi:type II secretory pathway pseudopilin PulG